MHTWEADSEKPDIRLHPYYCLYSEYLNMMWWWVLTSLLLQLPLFSFLLFNPDLILTPLEVAAGIVSELSGQ